MKRGVAALIFLCLPIAAASQAGVRGQILLPNGAPVPRTTRLTLTYDNGARNEIFYSDSNGRIVLPQINTPFTVTVDGDGENYDTTRVSFIPPHSGNYIIISLQPPKAAPKPSPGTVDANEVDRDVSAKAKEFYDAARKLLHEKQYKDAVAPLKLAISLQPDYFHAHNDLGVVYIKLNKLDEAVASLRQAIKINDRIYLPQLNLGIVLNRESRYKEAAEVLTKLRRRNPDLPGIHKPLIEALMAEKLWAQAEDELKRYVVVPGVDIVDLKNKLGAVLIRQSKFDRAAAVLREATNDEPNNALAQFNLGVALSESGSLDEAETALRQAYRIEGPKIAGAQFVLGQVYIKKKNYEKAIEAYETYLRDLPGAANEAAVKYTIQKLRQALRQ